MKFKIKERRRAPRTAMKAVRLTPAEAAAVEHLAEREYCDAATIFRYALSLLPGWKNLVRRMEQAAEAK